MNIEENGTRDGHSFWTIAKRFFGFLTTLTILGMSYNYIPENIIVLFSIIVLELYVYVKSRLAKPLYLVKKEKNETFADELSNRPLLTVLSTGFAVLIIFTFLTGNLFGWYIYWPAVVLSLYIYEKIPRVDKQNFLI